MDSERRLIFALPVYNEAENLKRLLEKIVSLRERSPFDVMVVAVDDGSSDDSLNLLKKFGCLTERHEVNKGLGKTISDALRIALVQCRPQGIIVTMDADNTQEPHDAIRMATLMDEQGFSLVVGSRYLSASEQRGVPWHRRALSWFLNLILRMLFPIKGIRDYTSGLRAYRADLLQAAFDHYGDELIQEAGFAYTVELLLKLRRFSPHAAEIAITLRYDQKQGATKMRLAETVQEYCALLWRMAQRKR